MKLLKKIVKFTVYLLSVPVIYAVISLISSNITIDRIDQVSSANKTVYLSTNGVHLDIVIPIEDVDTSLLSLLDFNATTQYVSFGWGDENFYINTPTWGDLTAKNTATALFLESSSLMHITRYSQNRSDWIVVNVTSNELKALTNYLLATFKVTQNGKSMLLEGQGYSTRDDFYKANGSYSCFNTCNSWVNRGFKKAGLKCCAWTPFDFGLLNKYSTQ